MSVVVYRNGIMAADSRAYGGSGCPSPGIKHKIHRLDDGALLGIVSAKLGEPERFLAWERAGAKPQDWQGDKPDLRAILVDTAGRWFLFEDSPWPSGPITGADYFAIGSGTEYALGALAMGADARRAVETAIQFDPNCGGPVITLHREAKAHG